MHLKKSLDNFHTCFNDFAIVLLLDWYCTSFVALISSALKKVSDGLLFPLPEAHCRTCQVKNITAGLVSERESERSCLFKQWLYFSLFVFFSPSGWCWVQCTDLGYHLSVSRVIRGYLSNRNRTVQNMKNGLQQLDTAVTGLNQGQDRDALLQAHNTAFCLPFRFQHQPHEGDQVMHKLHFINILQ